jgi:hypothetical protein
MSRKTTSAVLAAMAAVFLAGAAPGAWAAHLEVVEVRIHARHLDSDTDLGWINPGDTLVLPPRTEVKLWMEALPRGRGPRYPGAHYDVTDGVIVEGDRKRVAVRTDGGREVAGIRSSNPSRGTAVLQTYGREGESVVRYSIADTIRGLSIPRALRSSAFTVRVRDGAGIVPVDGRPWTAETEAVRELVAELYHGILLREPDPRGLADYGGRILEGGYPAAIAAAADIARSDESRFGVYRSGAGHDDRLAALYRHLLGLDPDDVDRDQWADDREALRAGDLERVVDEMARSEEFRRRFGFELRRYALPR